MSSGKKFNIDLSKAQTLSHWNSRKMFYHAGCMHKRNWTTKRGEVYFIDLGENVGSEENKIRPCVILQADSYSFKSPVVIAAIISNSSPTIPDIQSPITGKYPYVDNEGKNKYLTGTVDLGQIITVGKERLVSRKITDLTAEMDDINGKILNSLGLSLLVSKLENTITSLQGKIDFLSKKE